MLLQQKSRECFSDELEGSKLITAKIKEKLMQIGKENQSKNIFCFLVMKKKLKLKFESMRRINNQ